MKNRIYQDNAIFSCVENQFCYCQDCLRLSDTRIRNAHNTKTKNYAERIKQRKKEVMVWTFTFLSHFSPIFQTYTSWKRQKTKGFLTFSAGIEMEHWVNIWFKSALIYCLKTKYCCYSETHQKTSVWVFFLLQASSLDRQNHALLDRLFFRQSLANYSEVYLEHW